MKQFLNVFKFELSQILKQKSFYVTLIITTLIVFGMTFLPRFGDNSKNNQSEVKVNENGEISTSQDLEKIALIVNGKIDPSTKQVFEKNFKVREVKTEDEIKTLLNKEEITKGIVLNSDLNAKVITKDSSMFEAGNGTIQNLLENNYKYNIALEKEGISKEIFQKIENITSEVEYKSIGRNAIVGYIISYVALMFLYFTILMQGQGVSTDVAKEKDSRTMELLITNVKPKYLIWGKVMARAVVTFVQILALVLGIIIGFKINEAASPTLVKIVQSAFGSVKTTDLIFLFIFAITGVIMYYFLFAAFGSLVNKVEQLSQAVTPLMMIIVISFMIPMFSMTNPNSTVMQVVSYIPFTSPLAIFPRYLMTTMPTYEIFISYGILLLSLFILAKLSIKIYRYGTLNYGNKLNVFKLLMSKE